MTTSGRIVLGVIALSALAGFGLVYTGAYNVAADAPHSGLELRLLQAVRKYSVRARASTIAVPNLAADPSRLAIGAEHYAEMCADCHLAPDKTESELRSGLYPEPPNLMKAGQVDPAQAFWVIKHGIKLTSMPAWGGTHDDLTIWSIVAFIQQLPTLSAEEYRSLVGSGDDSEAREHDHDAHGDHHVENTPPHPESGEHHHENSEGNLPAARPGA